MTKKISNKDIEVFQKLTKSPLYFIRRMWNLNPQPIKKEFKEAVDKFVSENDFNKIRPEHFDKFEKGKHVTWQQWILLTVIERGLAGLTKSKLSVVSGHGIGKTATLSWTLLWYLFSHPEAQIGCTAPTSDQIHDVLWKEAKIWIERMPEEFRTLYEWQTGYIRMTESPDTWFARARTARKEAPEAISGLHADFVGIFIDEASGVHDEVYRHAEGSLTGENTLVILISNGTKNMGYFYDTHNSHKQFWQTVQLNSEESPIVNKEFVDKLLAQYGRDSDEYNIRVLGKFPASESMDDQGWIPLITDHEVRQVSDGLPFVGKKWMGIDPSGEGDDATVWVIRDRFQARVVLLQRQSTDKSIALATYDLIKEMNVDPRDITVGAFGVGMNVRAELLLLDHSLDIFGLYEGDDANDKTVYMNVRAEMAFRGREWLIRGGTVVGDEIKRDIIGIAYTNTTKGKKKIMSKHDLKKRIGRSPDRGDAFFMTFASDYSMDYHSNEETLLGDEQGDLIHQGQYDAI